MFPIILIIIINIEYRHPLKTKRNLKMYVSEKENISVRVRVITIELKSLVFYL